LPAPGNLRLQMQSHEGAAADHSRVMSGVSVVNIVRLCGRYVSPRSPSDEERSISRESTLPIFMFPHCLLHQDRFPAIRGVCANRSTNIMGRYRPGRRGTLLEIVGSFQTTQHPSQDQADRLSQRSSASIKGGFLKWHTRKRTKVTSLFRRQVGLWGLFRQ